MFWVPHPASLGLGVSILTYAGEVVIGVRADSAVMPEPAVLVRLFEEGLGAIVPGCAGGLRDRRVRRGAEPEPTGVRAARRPRRAGGGRSSRRARRSSGPEPVARRIDGAATTWRAGR
jgi:diacylglycerol O-acyltransferase